MATHQELKATADKRWKELTEGQRPWIRIGTAICGHAAGALDTLAALNAKLGSSGVEAAVDEVGCLGICYAEPLVDVTLPGGLRLFFRNVGVDDVDAIVDGYIKGGNIPAEGVMGYLPQDGGPQGVFDGVPNLNDIPQIGRQSASRCETRAPPPRPTFTSTLLAAATPV